MEYRFTPKGVCSKEFIFDIEDDIVQSVKIVGGCAGNAIGISKLVEGMKIEEVIERLKGVPCGYRGTSCPDQLATALEELMKNM